MLRLIFLLSVILISHSVVVNGFAVTVDAHEETCFYEDVTAGTKLGVLFQVAEGGFLDIDLTITGPDTKIIYSGSRETDGKYTFSAHMDGKYSFCFGNKMSTVTPKLVVFTITISGQDQIVVQDDTEGADPHDKFHTLTNELAEAIVSIKREQDYMIVRERTHRQINDSTNSAVIYWSFFEALVLVIMSIGQVYYLHRFFETRTVV